MTINDLKTYGANTEEGLGRCMNNESFYLRLVKMIPGDASFPKLYDAVENGDLDIAFEAAHALKGVTANMALTPILTPVQQITELLRNRTQADYGPLLAEIEARRVELLG